MVFITSISLTAFGALLESGLLDLKWVLPPSRAKSTAMNLNKPILYVCFVGKGGNTNAKGIAGDIHGAINNAPQSERDWIDEGFVPTYTFDVRDAQELDIRMPPAAVVTDPFGNIISKEESITTWAQIKKTAKIAEVKYQDKEPKWRTESVYDVIKFKTPKDEHELCKELIVYAFGSQEEKNSRNTIETLSNRVLVRLHQRIVFVALPFRKDGSEEAKWKVKDEGHFFVLKIDKTEEEGFKVIKYYKKAPPPITLYKLFESEFDRIEREQDELDKHHSK